MADLGLAGGDSMLLVLYVEKLTAGASWNGDLEDEALWAGDCHDIQEGLFVGRLDGAVCSEWPACSRSARRHV